MIQLSLVSFEVLFQEVLEISEFELLGFLIYFYRVLAKEWTP